MKRKRGRPRTSTLDAAAQNRERQREHRERLRQGGMVPVEALLPASWHQQLLKAGVTLREFIVEAVRRLMVERGMDPGVVSPPDKSPPSPKPIPPE